jgi:hypothetical protein
VKYRVLAHGEAGGDTGEPGFVVIEEVVTIVKGKVPEIYYIICTPTSTYSDCRAKASKWNAEGRL